MADRNKFEEMLERLVNEDRAGAEELFHEIVVEKSRDIYESLLEDDLDIEANEGAGLSLDQAREYFFDKHDFADENIQGEYEKMASKMSPEDAETLKKELEEFYPDVAFEGYDEGFDLEEFEVEGDEDDMDMGGDPADDMMSDIETDMDDEGDDDDDEEMEDRIVDLEDALDDLKAEFEKMMADDDDGDDDMDMGEPEDEDEDKEEESFEFEAEEKDDDEESKEMDEVQQMREYVEKVAMPKGEDNKASSPVASTNDMGGDSGNLVQGGEETGRNAPDAKEENLNQVNVPGSKTATTMSSTKGHGAEKKGAGETADNKKSGLGS